MSEHLTSGMPSPLLSAVALAALALLPFIVAMGTSFAKFSIVLTLLRSALGTQNAPSNMVLSGLALMLTLFVMAPVGEAMWNNARVHVDSGLVTADAPATTPSSDTPSSSDTSEVSEAATVEPTASVEPGESDTAVAVVEPRPSERWIRAASETAEPWRAFLVANSGSRELGFFLERRASDVPARGPEDVTLDIAAPAFLLTELSEAFQIGFLLFLPFILVDLLVGSVLLALGMHMLTPTTVSLPIKLMLFVFIDGWLLLSESLLLGYTLPN